MQSKFLEHPVKAFAINLRVQVLIRTNPRKLGLVTTTASLNFNDPVRVEKRRIMRERVKAEYPNGIPPLQSIRFGEDLHCAKDGEKDQGSPAQPGQYKTAGSGPDFFDQVRVEKRRILRECMKADYPNGVPPPYKLIDT